MWPNPQETIIWSYNSFMILFVVLRISSILRKCLYEIRNDTSFCHDKSFYNGFHGQRNKIKVFFLYFYILYFDWIRRDAQHSVWMRENTDQKNSEYGHFSRSVPWFFLLKLMRENVTLIDGDTAWKLSK